MNKFFDYINKNGIVAISLMCFFFTIWHFIIGYTYRSLDFYNLHLIFEHAYRLLDRGLSIHNLNLFLQMGMANSYLPFGSDFIFTYLLAKLLGINSSIGLLRIDILRMVLLIMVFAFGCRQFAREILKYRYSVDFVFFISLFVGGFYLPNCPAIILSILFLPWLFFYLTRVAKGDVKRISKNIAELTFIVILCLSQRFNNITALISLTIFYLIGLIVFNLWNLHLQAKKVWIVLKSFKKAALISTSLMISIILLLFLFRIFESRYFGQNVKNNLYSVITTEYKVTMDWSISMPLLFPYLDKIGKMNTQGNADGLTCRSGYLGMIVILFLGIGVFFNKNRFRFPVLMVILFYILFSFNLISIIPTVRFSYLYITPFLCVLAGMGMDMMLDFKKTNIQKLNKKSNLNPVFKKTILLRDKIIGILLKFFYAKKNKRKILASKIIMSLIIVVLAVMYLAFKMIQDTTFWSVYQGYLFSFVFVALSLLTLYFSIDIQNIPMRFRLYMVIALLDLCTFYFITDYFIGSKDLSMPSMNDILNLELIDNYTSFPIFIVSCSLLQLISFILWFKIQKYNFK